MSSFHLTFFRVAPVFLVELLRVPEHGAQFLAVLYEALNGFIWIFERVLSNTVFSERRSRFTVCSGSLYNALHVMSETPTQVNDQTIAD